jgi:hypothetical protein
MRGCISCPAATRRLRSRDRSTSSALLKQLASVRVSARARTRRGKRSSGPHLLCPCRRVTRTYGRLAANALSRKLDRQPSSVQKAAAAAPPQTSVTTAGGGRHRRTIRFDTFVWGRARTETMMMDRSTGLGVCTCEP